MKFINAIRTGLLLSLAFVSLAYGQSNLILPSSPDDMRKLMKTVEPGPCTLCGTVSNVRTKERAAPKRMEQPRPNGPNLIATPIIGKGDSVKRARERDSGSTVYVITVRYDNGQYASFEQDDKPAVSKGDKINVVEGRVEFR